MPIAGSKPTPAMGPQDIPIWITLDPTPALQRQQSIAQVGGVAGNFRPLTDVFRHIWIFYIIGYDGDRQDRLLYTADARDDRLSCERSGSQVGDWIKEWFTFLFHFRDVTAFISIRGFFVSFFVLTLLAGLVHLVFLIDKACLEMASWSPGRFDLAHGGHPLLSAIGPVARPVRAGAHTGGNPE